MTTRIDYEVVTAAGTTVFTSSDEDLARAFLRDRMRDVPGLIVEEVVRSEIRRRVYRPRPTPEGSNVLPMRRAAR